MNNEKWKLLLEGEVLEGGERFYRYNNEKNEIQYSDDKINIVFNRETML